MNNGCCNSPTTRSICGEFDDPDVTDLGQCFPLSTLRDCEAPSLPVPECDEEEPTVNYDPETGTFTMTTTLYDSECSAITDSAGSPLLTLVG